MKMFGKSFWVGVGVISLLVAAEAVANTGAEFGGAEFVAQTDKIKGFLFGPAVKLAGVVGGFWGLAQSVLSSSAKPLIFYGGMGLAVNLVPKFIDNVYSVSGALLP
jgi:hypothetical protein